MKTLLLLFLLGVTAGIAGIYYVESSKSSEMTPCQRKLYATAETIKTNLVKRGVDEKEATLLVTDLISMDVERVGRAVKKIEQYNALDILNVALRGG